MPESLAEVLNGIQKNKTGYEGTLLAKKKNDQHYLINFAPFFPLRDFKQHERRGLKLWVYLLSG